MMIINKQMDLIVTDVVYFCVNNCFVGHHVDMRLALRKWLENALTLKAY